MSERPIDQKRALALLYKINAAVDRDPELIRKFEYRSYNLWASYQSRIFSDIKEWTRQPEGIGAPSITVRLKICATSAFLVGASLISFISILVSRPRFAIFTEDKLSGSHRNDFRLDPLYAALKQEGASYFEVIHAVQGKEMMKLFFRRRRPVIYLEAADMLAWPWIRLGQRSGHALKGEFSPEEQLFADRIVAKYLAQVRVTRVRVGMFAFALRLIRPQAFFGIDDTRYYGELALASEICGLPFIALQHGHFTRYHPGWLKMVSGRCITPARLVVWTEYWKSELLRLGTYFSPESIVVGGVARLLESETVHDGVLRVVVPYETDAPKAEVRRYIEKFLNCSGVEVVFSVRADRDKAEQLKEYGLDIRHPRLKAVRSIYDILPTVDAAAGTYSTFFYDLIAAQKPVLIMDTSIDYGSAMVENGLADRLASPDFACEVLKKAAELPERTLQERREKLCGPDPLMLEDTLRMMIRSYLRPVVVRGTW